MLRLLICIPWLLLVFSGCKSWGKFWTLKISSISPADGSTGNATQSVITIVFDQVIQISSVNINTADQTCSGNIQFSVTDFRTCIRLKSVVSAEGGTALRITGYGFPNGQTARVKVTTALRSEGNASLETDYISGGFKIVSAPCGSNCFVDLGATPTAPNAGAHAFAIVSGIHEGKILYIPGSSLVSYLLNTDTMAFSAGPSLTVCGTNNTSAETIRLKTGPHAGKYLSFRVNNSTATCLYDPATNSYSANTASSLPSNSFQAGFHIFEMISGGQSGKFFILTGNTGTTSAIYDPATNGFSDSITLPTAGLNLSSSLAIKSGTNTGKQLVFFGQGTTDTALFNPVNISFNAVVALTPAPFQGYATHWLDSGAAAGKAIIFTGGNTANARFYNPDSNTFSNTADTVNLISTGSRSFLIPYGANAGKILLPAGGGFNNTELYNPGVGGISGPPVPFTVDLQTLAFEVETGIYPQAWVIVTATNSAVYFP